MVKFLKILAPKGGICVDSEINLSEISEDVIATGWNKILRVASSNNQSNNAILNQIASKHRWSMKRGEI